MKDYKNIQRLKGYLVIHNKSIQGLLNNEKLLGYSLIKPTWVLNSKKLPWYPIIKADAVMEGYRVTRL